MLRKESLENLILAQYTECNRGKGKPLLIYLISLSELMEEQDQKPVVKMLIPTTIDAILNLHQKSYEVFTDYDII